MAEAGKPPDITTPGITIKQEKVDDPTTELPTTGAGLSGNVSDQVSGSTTPAVPVTAEGGVGVSGVAGSVSDQVSGFSTTTATLETSTTPGMGETVGDGHGCRVRNRHLSALRMEE